MIKNLKDAMVADINNIYLSQEERRKIISGDTSAINYMKGKQKAILFSNFNQVINRNNQEDDSYVKRYLSKYGNRNDMLNQVRKEFPAIKKYLNTTDIFSDIAEFVVEGNFVVPDSLENTMFKVIDYYTASYDLNDKYIYSKIQNLVKEAVEKYLYEKNPNYFSLKNASYLYVVDTKNGFVDVNSKVGDIQDEMYDYCVSKIKDEESIKKMGTLQGKIDTYAAVVTNSYLEKNKLLANNNLNNNTCFSFDQAVYETISKYFKYNLDHVSFDDIKKICDFIFDEYFNKNNVNAFTSSNGARDFIINYKGDILDEMKRKTNFSYGGERLNDEVMKKSILNNYSNFLSNKIKNNGKNEKLNSFKESIYLKIRNMNINDNYKKTLTEYVDNDDYDNLWRNGVLTYEETVSYKDLLNEEKIKKGPRI